MSEKLFFRGKLEIGANNYHIGNEALYFSNFDPVRTETYVEEKYTTLLFNLSVGLFVKL